MSIECYYTYCPHHDRTEPTCGKGECTASQDDLDIYARTRAKEEKLWKLEKDVVTLKEENEKLNISYSMEASDHVMCKRARNELSEVLNAIYALTGEDANITTLYKSVERYT